jgi:hypothetical protein
MPADDEQDGDGSQAVKKWNLAGWRMKQFGD